ncbi:hypothetical protein [Endozoicomonas sp.]|uniref:hypothetical protein n=1 Tax=Endozoicomonas sp. TaxID=1892382 RepID=UPI0028858B25|nr:hypothetical protein [Endozoicomonas sp.]
MNFSEIINTDYKEPLGHRSVYPPPRCDSLYPPSAIHNHRTCRETSAESIIPANRDQPEVDRNAIGAKLRNITKAAVTRTLSGATVVLYTAGLATWFFLDLSDIPEDSINGNTTDDCIEINTIALANLNCYKARTVAFASACLTYYANVGCKSMFETNQSIVRSGMASDPISPSSYNDHKHCEEEIVVLNIPESDNQSSKSMINRSIKVLDRVFAVAGVGLFVTGTVCAFYAKHSEITDSQADGFVHSVNGSDYCQEAEAEANDSAGVYFLRAGLSFQLLLLRPAYNLLKRKVLRCLYGNCS